MAVPVHRSFWPALARPARVALFVSTLVVGLQADVLAERPDPHHQADEHSFDRVEEARIDRVQEPADAWSGPPERDTSGAVDSPIGIRTPGPTPNLRPSPAASPA